MTTMKTDTPRTVEAYLDLPYTIEITPDPSGGYAESVAELPGCITQAETWAEINALIRDAMAGWIAIKLEDGLPVPLPADPAVPARVLLRLPRSLHRELTLAADREGVSFNQYLVYQLARAVGKPVSPCSR